MTPALRRVCVFAGSSPGARASYRRAAAEMGEAIASRGSGLVYGGASVGLMGTVADAALGRGGEVLGIITEALIGREIAHAGLTGLEVVGTMHDRKARMADLADAFVMLPGGFGTYEEFMEAVTWAQLGIHDKPCGVLNVDGFFDGLLEFLQRATAERFIRTEHADIVRVHHDPAGLLDELERHRPPRVEKWLDSGQR